MPRTPFEGSSRRIVLGFDIGTSYSGISYCVLDPGEIPMINSVSRQIQKEIDRRLKTFVVEAGIEPKLASPLFIFLNFCSSLASDFLDKRTWQTAAKCRLQALSLVK